MKKFWLGFLAGIVFTIISLVFTAFLISIKIEKDMQYKPQQNLVAPIELPEKGTIDYQEIIDNSKPVVALFYVDWCGYCRRFMPIFGQYALKYGKDYTFATINCDKEENIELVHKNKIRSFPSLKIIDEKYDVVVPIDISATQSEKVFELEVKKYLKLREQLN